MFGKKRIQLADYCEGMYQHVFSPHYDRVAEAILEDSPESCREHIDQTGFMQNLHAAALELLHVAMSRNLKRDQRREARLLHGDLLTRNAFKTVDEVVG